MKKSMKSLRLITVLTLIALLMAATISVNAYDYELSLSAGNGEFDTGDVRVKTTASTTITITNGSSTFTIGTDNPKNYTVSKMPDGDPADSKYFVRGVKYAGEDNDDVIGNGRFNFNGEDTELVVAYGLKSSMVEYTVHYRDADGNDLAGADTFYGVAGDQVIVSYKYVNGYLPQAWTGRAELSADPAENDFVFWYRPFTPGEGNTYIIDDGTVIINNGVPGGPGGAGGAAGAGTDIGDNAAPTGQPADVVNLNDNDTPLAGDVNGDGVIDENDLIDDNAVPGSLGKTIGIGAGVVAAIALAALLIARRRRDEEEEEQE